MPSIMNFTIVDIGNLEINSVDEKGTKVRQYQNDDGIVLMDIFDFLLDKDSI